MSFAEKDEDCVSKFFQNNHANQVKSQNIIKAEPTEDTLSSQDTSRSSDTELSLSQLTIEEEQPLNIPPFYNITPRELPVSPHYVMEEQFSKNPWSIFVATIFLTKTAGKTARPYMKAFFEEYPTPYHVLDCCPNDLERFFDSLGLRKRADMIWKLSYQFVSAGWRRASDLYGIGKYGEDAYRIFCLGHTDLDPGDRYLKLYLDWLRGHTTFLEESSLVDCECVIEDPVLKYYDMSLRDAVR